MSEGWGAGPTHKACRFLHSTQDCSTSQPKPSQYRSQWWRAMRSSLLHTAVCLHGVYGYRRVLCVWQGWVERKNTAWGTAAQPGEATLELGNACTRASCWASQSSVRPARRASLVCEKQDGNQAPLSMINARNCCMNTLLGFRVYVSRAPGVTGTESG